MESIKDKEIALIQKEMNKQKKVHNRKLVAIHKEAKADKKHNVRLKEQLHSKDSKINELKLFITEL